MTSRPAEQRYTADALNMTARLYNCNYPCAGSCYTISRLAQLQNMADVRYVSLHPAGRWGMLQFMPHKSQLHIYVAERSNYAGASLDNVAHVGPLHDIT